MLNKGKIIEPNCWMLNNLMVMFICFVSVVFILLHFLFCIFYLLQIYADNCMQNHWSLNKHNKNLLHKFLLCSQQMEHFKLKNYKGKLCILHGSHITTFCLAHPILYLSESLQEWTGLWCSLTQKLLNGFGWKAQR